MESENISISAQLHIPFVYDTPVHAHYNPYLLYMHTTSSRVQPGRSRETQYPLRYMLCCYRPVAETVN